jgi:hypothetical protein
LQHGRDVLGVAYSPDGTLLATACWDGAARLWDARTGREGFTLRGHQKAVSAVAFTPYGSRLVTASDDGTARVWDTLTGSEVLVLREHTKSLRTAAFSPDGLRLVTASDDGTARVWHAGAGHDGGYDPWAEDAARRTAAWFWHEKDAAAAERSGAAFAAAFHLGRLLWLRPLDPALHDRRAAALDRLHRPEGAGWHRAAALLLRGLPSGWLPGAR